MLIAKLCDRLRLTILSLMLIALPLGLGGRAHWVLPALTITNAVALSLLFLESALSGRRPRIHRAWVVSGAILLLLCVQIVPGSGLVGMLSPHAATAWEQAYAAGLTELEPRMSLAPARTRMALAMLTQIALAGFLVYNTFRSRSRLLLLSASIAGAAFVNTLTALTPTVIGSPHLYSDLGISSTPLSGTYLNRNHFGFLVGLGLLQVSGLAWLIYNSGDNGTRTIHWKSLFPFLRKHLRSPMLVGLAMAAVPMTMSLVFSLSRGAAMATAVALLFFLAVLPKGQHRGRIREGTFALTAIVAVILVGSIEALLCLWGRYEALMELGNLGLAGRWNVWR
ncbi:MAG: O-antigen ligase family protein, partial [Candidatus Pacebacteria bacterium]|nr:O-antigen ligase family protein [Candidatus Paceibacterota bacterium]